MSPENNETGTGTSVHKSSVFKEHITEPSRRSQEPQIIVPSRPIVRSRPEPAPIVHPRTPEPAPAPAAAPKAFVAPAHQEKLEVRPIGTRIGFNELAKLHRQTWSNLNVEEKKVHMILWPLALHFGLYEMRGAEETGKRPRLIGAFWARCLADAPLTLGHLYPAPLFKGLYAADVWEFGGMVIEPTYQGKGLVKMMSETARLFLFSRRPKLLITNPVEPLYEIYRQFGMKAIGTKPVEHPHAYNVKVWLMYGEFEKLAKPYFM